jgi:hypothetical protein
MQFSLEVVKILASKSHAQFFAASDQAQLTLTSQLTAKLQISDQNFALECLDLLLIMNFR